jgi:hypothetical protein
MRLAEQGDDVSARVRTHQPIGSAVIETDSLQPVEIAQQLLPFWHDARFMQQVVEMLLHREGQEGTEHMAADGGVGRMEDRPRAHDRLGAQEEIFDLQQNGDSGARLVAASLSRWSAARRVRRNAPLRRAFQRRSQTSDCPCRRRPCVDSVDRLSCRRAPCRPSSIARRARRRSPRDPCGLFQPPPHCGRRCSACLRPACAACRRRG